MFWKILKWGGTAAVIALMLAAVFSSEPESSKADQQPTAPVQTNKKFNF